MKLSYTSRYEDYVAATRVAASTIFTPWQRYWCIPVYAGMTVIVVFVSVKIRDLLTPYIPSGSVGLLGFAVFVVFALLSVILVQRASTPLYAKWLRARRPEQDVVFEVAEEWLQARSGGTITKVAYSDIDQVAVERGLVCFILDVSVLYLPIKAFASPGEAKEMLSLVFPKMSQQARERSLKSRAVRELVGAGSGQIGLSI